MSYSLNFLFLPTTRDFPRQSTFTPDMHPEMEKFDQHAAVYALDLVLIADPCY